MVKTRTRLAIHKGLEKMGPIAVNLEITLRRMNSQAVWTHCLHKSEKGMSMSITIIIETILNWICLGFQDFQEELSKVFKTSTQLNSNRLNNNWQGMECIESTLTKQMASDKTTEFLGLDHPLQDLSLFKMALVTLMLPIWRIAMNSFSETIWWILARKQVIYLLQLHQA